jgi:hypothetical protein
MQSKLSAIALLKQPSAFVPVAMSFAALVIVLAHIIISGVAREADEGTTAHLWQLLMAAQIPVIAFFAIRWLPRSPRSALPVLALQAVAALVALAPVYLLNW